jgi:integrase
MPRAWSNATRTCRIHVRAKAKCTDKCNGGWRYRLSVPDPLTGVKGPPSWSPTFPDPKTADAHQRATRDAIAAGAWAKDRGMTVAVFLDAWLKRQKESGLKASTLSGYADIIRIHLKPHLGDVRLGDLGPRHVKGMLDRIAAQPALLKGRENPKPVGLGTLTNIRACLRSALAYAVELELVDKNVAPEAKIRGTKAKRAKPVSIPADRLAAFMQGTQGDALEVLWLLAVVYGERRGELAGLQWDDVDYDHRLLHIRHTLLEVKGDHPCPHGDHTHRRILFDTPKSEAGYRVYPLVSSVEAALRAHRARQDADRVRAGSDWSDHQLVFTQPLGDPWRPGWISSRFKQLMKDSGAAEGMARTPSIKALRSTMVTGLHELGAPIETIAKVAGHASGSTSRDYYLSVAAERTRAEFEILAQRLALGPAPE